MKFENKLDMIKGIVEVEIEGFFTERFINLCKVNNIKIFDVKIITSGVVRFNINIKEFKKLKNIAKKTKCRVSIKKKKGLYFNLFKYRKRKILFSLIFLVLIILLISNCFIWSINVNGYDKNIVIKKLLESNIYKGKLKLDIDKNIITKYLRSNLDDVSWVGVNINGTSMDIKIIKKVEELNKQNYCIGDIIATQNGVITKIIAENGTAMYKEGSYVQKGDILIKGTIFSKVLGEENVTAKGLIKTNCEYIFEKQYKYNYINRKDISKNILFGISINSKEFYINYLKKDKKYDKIKKSVNFDFIGLNFTFDRYEYIEYIEFEENLDKNKIISLAEIESNEYKNKITESMQDFNLIDEKVEIKETEDGLIYTKKIFVEISQGVFVGR
jgi:similar to stage IV sporulation protein